MFDICGSAGNPDEAFGLLLAAALSTQLSDLTNARYLADDASRRVRSQRSMPNVKRIYILRFQGNGRAKVFKGKKKVETEIWWMKNHSNLLYNEAN